MVLPTMARIALFNFCLMYIHFVVLLASPLAALSSSLTSEANSTSFGVDPPRNIVCAEDFGGLNAKPDYDDCERAIGLLPSGASA